MKEVLLFFVLCIFCSNAWSTNEQRHIEFLLKIDGEYRYLAIDSLCYFDENKNTFIKIESVVCDAKGISIAVCDYDRLISADSIFMYLSYHDLESNIQLSISIPLCKLNLSQSFMVNIVKYNKKGKYYFYLGKRKGLKGWIGLKKRKILQRFSISMDNGFSTCGFETEFPCKSGVLEIRW